MSHVQVELTHPKSQGSVLSTKPERRRSSRIQLRGPVKIGPPGEPAEALVSGRDISREGVFIDADTEVRVGARFSVEVGLDDGERVYVPEVEVAYNRVSELGSGFGARFVCLPKKASNAIARAILQAEEDTISTVPKPRTVTPASARRLPPPPPAEAKAISDRPSVPSVTAGVLTPSARPFPVDSTVPTEFSGPVLTLDAEPSLLSSEPMLLTLEPAESLPPLGRESFIPFPELGRRNWVERIKRSAMGRLENNLVGGLMVLGAVALLVAMVLTLSSTVDTVNVEPIHARPSGIPAQTHQILTGARGLDSLAKAPEPAPLPPPVAVSRNIASEAPAPTPVTAPVPAKPAPVASAPRRSSSASVRFGVEPSARVLKTHVFRNPPRFVLDLAGQEVTPDMPTEMPGIRQARFGRHPDFSRLVLDAQQEIELGQVEKRGGALVVSLSFVAQPSRP